MLRLSGLLTCLVFFITACGGGNSTTSSPTPTPLPPVSNPPPAGDSKAPPQGIFNSAGSLNTTNSGSFVSEHINGLPHVSGTLIRLSWSDINPAPAEYDFSVIERELQEAEALGDKVSLAIVDSKEMPQWLLDECTTFNFTFRGNPEVTCLPWDSTYQSYKQALISELGDQFDGHEHLAGIYITYAAMTNGVEMHWRVDEQSFTDAGYTFSKLSDAYNAVADMYMNYFPTTPVIMEVHTVFNSPALAQTAYDYCFDTIGERCGVAIWWCASRMTTDPREMEYAAFPVAQQAANNSFAICQTIASFTDEPERFAEGISSEQAFRNEMEFFIAAGFKNFELWTSDIQNDTLMDILNAEYLADIEN
ncbi:MAG: beta-galactosidase [Pseudomonadota bacterium]|nr:beta-galactosidase [Pseudomonadota bacterium]